MSKKLAVFGLVLLMVIVTSVTLMASDFTEGKVKVGFVFDSPINDYAWNFAHNQGRLALEEEFSWIETVYVEKVAAGEAKKNMEQFIMRGAKVIFAPGIIYQDAVMDLAQKYPDVIFAVGNGYKRRSNVATYLADMYQVYYLNGLVAGALTESNKVGVVLAQPIPELKRATNAFAIGVREVNSEANVHVKWTYSWFDPAAEKEATESLINSGCDVLTHDMSSPTPVQVAAENKIPTFSHVSPMYELGPDYVVSGHLVDYGKIYVDFMAKVRAGVYTPDNLNDVDYWWLLDEGTLEIGAKYDMPINPKYKEELKTKTVNDPVFGEISVYELVFKRLEEMEDPQIAFDPFQGPISDRNGIERVPRGVRPTVEELTSMHWAAKGIVGSWPDEPSE